MVLILRTFLTWLSIGSVGWFMKDITTPEATTGDVKKLRPVTVVFWAICVLGVINLCYDLWVYIKKRKNGNVSKNYKS